MSVPSASTPKPSHSQLTNGVTVISMFADCCPTSNCGMTMYRSSASVRRIATSVVGSILVLPEEPARGIHLGELGAVTQHRDLRRHHLLPAVVGDADAVEANAVVANLHRPVRA